MTNFNRYVLIEEEGSKAIMCDMYGDGIRTYVCRPEQFPLAPWQIANAMNVAFKNGYEQAQADIRKALGFGLRY